MRQNYTDLHCNHIYINRMKNILTLSPRVLGVRSKLLGAQSNTLESFYYLVLARKNSSPACYISTHVAASE